VAVVCKPPKKRTHKGKKIVGPTRYSVWRKALSEDDPEIIETELVGRLHKVLVNGKRAS
jgi:hypothetical protein